MIGKKKDIMGIKTIVLSEEVPQEVTILEKQNCRVGRKNPVDPFEGLNHFYEIQLFLDRQQEMNTCVVWGWHVAVFAWDAGSVWFKLPRQPQVWGALSVPPSDGRVLAVCAAPSRNHGKLAWHRSNVSNEALALASILKLGFCKSCKSPEEILEHRRLAYHGLH